MFRGISGQTCTLNNNNNNNNKPALKSKNKNQNQTISEENCWAHEKKRLRAQLARSASNSTDIGDVH